MGCSTGYDVIKPLSKYVVEYSFLLPMVQKLFLKQEARRVIVENKLARFCWDTVHLLSWSYYVDAADYNNIRCELVLDLSFSAKPR